MAVYSGFAGAGQIPWEFRQENKTEEKEIEWDRYEMRRQMRKRRVSQNTGKETQSD